MGKVLDFTKQKKEYLTVKLNDEKNTVLMIGTPTKAILREFIAINERINEDGGADTEAINDLYNVCAKVMSFNKGGIKITADYLEPFFDIEDVMIFFNAYTEFMSSITNAKN
jgi:hypothetical protein